MERGLLGGFGIAVALFGGLFFVMFLTTLLSGGDGKTEPGVLAGLVVFFGGMTAGGLFLAWRMFRHRPASAHGVGRPGAAGPGQSGPRRPAPGGGGRGAAQGGRGFGAPASGLSASPPPPQTPEERERSVLRFAETEHGRVTVPEVATNCDISLADAKETLDQLVLLAVAEIRVTESGVLVYVFPGFLSDKEKASATDF